MKTFWLVAGVLLLPVPALALDVDAPVRAVMAAAEANWSDQPGEYQDYFSKERLATLYSAGFVALYRAASDTPFAREAGTPFDWDVIVNAQDGCPLQNLSVTPSGREGDATLVSARFQNMTCFGTDPEYQAYSEATFVVVEEDGRAVIDDIVQTMDGERLSLSAQMREIAGQQ
jgi:hypothetical protein